MKIVEINVRIIWKGFILIIGGDTMKNLTNKPQYYDGSGNQSNTLDIKQMNTDIIINPKE